LFQVDSLIGPLLFISFIILGGLFLLNVFIAILSEAYEKAKIQVFGDAFDEHEEEWKGAPTFNEYFNEYIIERGMKWGKKACHKSRITPVRPSLCLCVARALSHCLTASLSLCLSVSVICLVVR